jgi:RHS repeat-associated protein
MSDSFVYTGEYVFFGGKRIARIDSSGNTGYYFADHLGSSRVVTNSSGSILDDSDFYPFGGERPITSSSGNSYKFTGQERDSESGLDNFGARYYSSNMGRFMSPDPDNAGASPDNPQSWNAYAYVLGNPLNLTDPDGLGPCDNDPNQCIEVTALLPVIDPFFFRLSEQLSSVAQRTQTYLDVAWKFWINTKPNPGCVAASTASGAVGGAVILGKAGFDLGAAGGAIGGTLAEPGGGTALGFFGGGALGGGAGTIAGAGVGGGGGWLLGQVVCRTGGGGRGGRAGRTSTNQMNQQVQSGQAPRSVDRVDTPRFPHEQPHIEFKDGNALNIDGTWKHGGRALTNEEAQWISSNGWSLPR